MKLKRTYFEKLRTWIGQFSRQRQNSVLLLLAGAIETTQAEHNMSATKDGLARGLRVLEEGFFCTAFLCGARNLRARFSTVRLTRLAATNSGALGRLCTTAVAVSNSSTPFSNSKELPSWHRLVSFVRPTFSSKCSNVSGGTLTPTR